MVCPECGTTLGLAADSTAKNIQCGKCKKTSPASKFQAPAPRGSGQSSVTLIALGTFLLGGLGGCAVGCTFGHMMATSSTSSSASSSTRALLPKPTAQPEPLACHEAPSVIVETINAAFTNGEHLEHAQSVNGSHAETYVGGNIVDAGGTELSTQDSWVLSNGVVYALTSDARRHTTLPDGRDLKTHEFDWTDYNDGVGKCVGDAARAANRAGGR